MDKSTDKLTFRQVGRGFIISALAPGMPAGRRLTKTYVDQFKKTYIVINGRYELLTSSHEYLPVD